MFGSLDISTSGLIAHRTRMDAISANIANADVILNEAGENVPFQRRIVQLASGDPESGSSNGVHVASIDHDVSPPRMKYEPFSPYANAQGYVAHPNVDIVIEQMNALEATRSYQANITAIEATKSMMSVALEMLA